MTLSSQFLAKNGVQLCGESQGDSLACNWTPDLMLTAIFLVSRYWSSSWSELEQCGDDPSSSERTLIGDPDSELLSDAPNSAFKYFLSAVVSNLKDL